MSNPQLYQLEIRRQRILDEVLLQRRKVTSSLQGLRGPMQTIDYWQRTFVAIRPVLPAALVGLTVLSGIWLLFPLRSWSRVLDLARWTWRAWGVFSALRA